MKILDTRLRPPIPSLVDTWMYDSEAMEHFAKFFGPSYLDESSKKRDMNMLLQDMKKHQVRGMMSLRSNGEPFKINDDGKEVLEKYSNDFYGLAAVDAINTEEAFEIIDKYVVNGPYTGVHLEPISPPPGQPALNINDERIYPVIEKCQELGLPVSVLTGPCGFDGTASRSDRIFDVCNTFPNVKFMFLHGAWPEFRSLCGVMAMNNNVYVSPDSYIMYLPGWRDYVDAANYLLQDQICYGSSYPLHSMERVINFYLHEAGFRTEVLPKVMWDNTARFLGLEEGYPQPTWTELIMSRF